MSDVIKLPQITALALLGESLTETTHLGLIATTGTSQLKQEILVRNVQLTSDHQEGKESEVAQSCPTLSDPLDCSL